MYIVTDRIISIALIYSLSSQARCSSSFPTRVIIFSAAEGHDKWHQKYQNTNKNDVHIEK